MVPNPNTLGGKSSGSHGEKSSFSKWGKKHVGKLLVSMDNCFCCWKSGHMVRDFPMEKTQGSEGNQNQESGLNFNSRKKIQSYAFKSKGYQECSYNYVASTFN